MILLAIDPGTQCGWALRLADGTLTSGKWDLRPLRHEGAGMRWLRFRAALEQVARAAVPELVAFEEVHRHLGTDAAHVYGGLVAHLQAWCESKGIPYTGIPVGTVKKHATGKGNADKDQVRAAAQAKWPEQDVGEHDYDQADALWILESARRQYDAGAAQADDEAQKAAVQTPAQPELPEVDF